MSSNYALVRTLSARLDNACVKVPVELSMPYEQESEFWRCDYRIMWPDNVRESSAFGVDGAQAIMLAFSKISAELYTSELHKHGKLFWHDEEQGYGFPILEAIKELSVGIDRPQN